MKLTDILAKLKEADVDQATLDAISALDNSAELEAEKGKNAGILADKKKYQDRAKEAEKRAEDAEATLKKIEDDKLPEAERFAKEKQALEDKLAAEKAEREADKAKFAQVQREAAESDIAGSIHWTEGTPQGTAKMIIKNALAEVEDLSDKEAVDKVLNSVKDTHKSFIAAEAPAGTGDKGGTGGKIIDGDESSTIAGNQEAVWAGK